MTVTTTSRTPAYLALPAISKTTVWISGTALISGIFFSPALFVLYSLTDVNSNKLLISAIISSFSIVGGVLGLIRVTPSILASLMVAIGTCYAATLFGGVFLLSLLHVELQVKSFLDQEYIFNDMKKGRYQPDITKLRDKVILFLVLSGIFMLLIALVNGILARHLYYRVGEKRACVAFLQIFSLITLPFSLFLVIGGQYIVDSGTLATEPYTGLAIFSCGLMMLSISLLAFLGGNFEYRRLLIINSFLSFIVGTIFLGLAIAYFCTRKNIQESIVVNWQYIRVILPTTFSAKYDEQQFVLLVQSNLELVSFIGIITGGFFLIESNICTTLKQHMDVAKRQMAHDKQSMKKFAIAERNEATSLAQHSLTLRHEWYTRFQVSTKRQRIAMRIVMCLLVISLLLILCIMCASVFYTTRCNLIGDVVTTSKDSLIQAEKAQFIDTIYMKNTFSRGNIIVSPSKDTNGSIKTTEYSNQETKSHNFFSKEVDGNTTRLFMSPAKTSKFLWLDRTCQRMIFEAEVPQDTLRSLEIESDAHVTLQNDDSNKLELKGVNITTNHASIKAEGISILEGGFQLSSQNGEIQVSKLKVDGGKINSVTAIYSAVGRTSIINATFVETNVRFETGASPLEILNVIATNDDGRRRVLSKTQSGTIYLSLVQANWISLQSEYGNILGKDLITTGVNTFQGRLEATSIAGDILLENVVINGLIHAETSSGNIFVALKSLSYVGLYYLRSEYGNVTVRRGKFSTDSFENLPTGEDPLERHGRVNCQLSPSECLYLGDIHIRSQYGNIELVLGCDNTDCL